MKKILYSLIFTLCLVNFSFAQDSFEAVNQILNTNIQATPEMIQQVNNALGAQVMPNDELLIQAIQRYNIPPEQASQVFSQAKLELQKMQETGDIEKYLNEQLKANQAQVSQEVQEVKEVQEQTKERVKKYTNHSPLTRRSNSR